ncbi:aminopeptidase n [Stylonychia lemnae]|uniref:Aminopeptidase n n=1 Tax=Stylonychia lemnae TaxID=5949 RepID=A0A078B5Z0_STYLE|nr:aminopeptidase n [Stylonychia lemnae]|eukprot:CDW89925.1 aminopeptidase n [Stylonychia lemnae]
MSFSDQAYDTNIYIKRSDCEFRKEYVKDVTYNVQYCLPKGDHYFGLVNIDLTLNKIPHSRLFLDFRGVSISGLTVNGTLVEEATCFRDHKIYLPSNLLLGDGQNNKISINVHNKYRKDGMGLHTFNDNQDNVRLQFINNIQAQYLYTQFEADYCHFVIPVFDQPDIKAKWTFSAVVPTEWNVVSNEAVDESASERMETALAAVKQSASIFGIDFASVGDVKVHTFHQSFKISTYLYAICAGPYEYQERVTEGFPKMRIYARRSLIKDCDFSEMFTVTQAGMKFYHDLFGKQYPFNKYDQIFTPEHNFGAMENVGCVTYNEMYLFRGEIPSIAKRLRFSNTNLHELAHMWFGNLVTMKWWNDLWLNESFATFMAYLCQANSPELSYFKTSWVTFLQYKFWGINEDILSKTHPITCEIGDTGEAENLFDGISYGKGASFLKQVYNLLGHEVVKRGLHAYFENFQWQNTELKDFVGTLNEAYLQYGNEKLGKDFNFLEWCESWLTTSGVNILEPVVSYREDGSIEKLQVRQTNDLRGKNRLRSQMIDVAVYDENYQPTFIRDIMISDSNELNEIEVPHQGKVTIINVNANDHAYAKIRYDQRTFDNFVSSLHRVNDAVTRGQVWRSLWLLVVDRKISSMQYFHFVVEQLQYESVDQIIQVALMNLTSLISLYLPTSEVLGKKRIMFETLKHLLQRSDIEPSTRVPIVDNLFGFASSPDHIKVCLDWLEIGAITSESGEEIFKLAQKHKQSIVKLVFPDPSFDLEFKNALLEKTLGDDKSDIAVNVRETCNASLPDTENKRKVWDSLIDHTTQDSIYKRGARMSGFYNWKQLDIVQPYFDEFYEILPTIYEKTPFKYVESFFYSLLPRMEIHDRHIVKLLQLKNATPDNQSNFASLLSEGTELILRQKLIREFAEKSFQEKL